MDPEKVNYHYCDDLPTQPLPPGTRVLVTGASGYVASRLIPELVARGYIVRCMFRNMQIPVLLTHSRIEVVYADCLIREELSSALEDVHTAYYLIHSMRAKNSEFQERDRLAAQNFREVAEEKNLKRIIYLGGLGETNERLSTHLASRMEVGKVLSDGSIPTISLRAAIIIGTGSASYELLKSIVNHQRWIPFLTEFNSRCQPIAVRDVIKYLVGVLETDGLTTRVYPIGGKDILPYSELLKVMGRLFEKRIRLFNVSWFPMPIKWMCRVYAYWLNFFISVPVNITSLLLNSLKTDVVCLDHSIKDILEFELFDFETAVKRAQEKERDSRVFSHWTDVPPENMSDLMPLCEYESAGVLLDAHSIEIPACPSDVFPVICQIGGKHGWVHANFLWEIRGAIDRLLGGVGLNRGRRDDNQLRVGDSVDFWRVENLVPHKELLLRAEMISPGLSWLQFELQPKGEGRTLLTLRAHFIPKPFWGNLYWWSMFTFHNYIFEGMLKHFYEESTHTKLIRK